MGLSRIQAGPSLAMIGWCGLRAFSLLAYWWLRDMTQFRADGGC